MGTHGPPFGLQEITYSQTFEGFDAEFKPAGEPIGWLVTGKCNCGVAFEGAGPDKKSAFAFLEGEMWIHLRENTQTAPHAPEDWGSRDE